MSATISNPTTSTAPGSSSKLPIADSSQAGAKRNVGKAGLVYLLAPVDAVSVGAATLALDDTYCGKYINLDNASSAISINTDNIADGFNCIVVNNTGSSYTFPSVTGTGSSRVGPLNGDTKIPNTGIATILAVGNAVHWRGDSTT